MSTPPPHPGLEKVMLFRALPELARPHVYAQCRFRKFPAGQVIFDIEDESRDVFFVLQGLVRVVFFSPGGREVAFNVVSAGGCFGELSAIDGSARSATCVARTNAELAILPASSFQRMVCDYPETAMAMMEHLSAMVRLSTGRIVDLSVVAANNRVQGELLRLAKEVAGERESATLRPPPIHSEVASRVSTTRETVARVFSDLTRQGLVEKTRGGIIVADIPKLEELVEQGRG